MLSIADERCKAFVQNVRNHGWDSSTSFWLYKMLETMTLHDGMILSTLSLNSHGFALMPHTNGDVFNPLISRRETPLSTILPSNKAYHRVSSEAYGAFE